MSDTKAEGSYKASDMNADVEKEIDRLRAQTLWTWEKESRTLRWYGLKGGMSVLELGSGPGFVSEQLMEMLPESHITLYERDPDMVLRSEQYLSPGYSGRFTVVEGDIMSIDLPDNSFDFAYARYLFQHLPDPAGALREVYRVLKPGGTLAVVDVDTALGPIFEPPSPEADAIDDKISKLQTQKGGNRDIGRRLWRLLASVGFQEMDLDAIVAHSDKLGADTIMPPDWDPGSLQPYLDAGVINTEDVEVMYREHIKFHTSPDKYILLALLMAKGVKPGLVSGSK